jgi:hypothetical protein
MAKNYAIYWINHILLPHIREIIYSTNPVKSRAQRPKNNRNTGIFINVNNNV